MSVTTLLWPSVLGLALTLSGTLVAQSSADRAMAESLFQEGLRLMDSGRPQDACPKFEQSARLESAIGTLLNLGACYEALGKTASAWAEYSRALALAERSADVERSAFAQGRIDELSLRLAHVVLVRDDDSQEPLLSVDGRELQSGIWGASLPLDPGEHLVEASSAGFQTWSTTIELPKGPEKIVVRVPALQPVEPPPKPALQSADESVAAPSPASSSVQQSSPAGMTERSAGGNAQLWLWTSAGFALAGVGVGTFAMLDYNTQMAEVRKHCRGSFCDDQGLEADDQARSSALLADVSFGVAAVAAVAAGYFWYSLASEDQVAVAGTVGPNGDFFVNWRGRY